MAEMSLPTIIEGNGMNGLGGGFGGLIGGLVLGSLWNGNGFGFGNRGGQAAADVSLANAVEHVSDQVNQGTISALQSANQTQQTINSQTVAGLQSNAQLSDKVAGATFGLAQQIDQTGDQTAAAINQANIQSMQNVQQLSNQLCCINQNITNQGYENRLQAQSLAAQLAQQHAELSRQIFEENCKDRELQREIQTQAIRDQLAQAQAANAALAAQINLTNQLTQQTAYLINRLEPNTVTTTATTAS